MVNIKKAQVLVSTIIASLALGAAFHDLMIGVGVFFALQAVTESIEIHLN